MAKKVTIWTLNKASELIKDKKQEIRQIFEGGWFSSFSNNQIECEFGERQNPKPSNQLMYEEDPENYDEYFVPIPLKCIGNKIFQQDKLELDTQGQELLQGIKSNYAYFF